MTRPFLPLRVLQWNLKRVRPVGSNVRWSTDFTQTPMAPDSLLDPFRALIVFLTFLIHRQNRLVWDSFILLSEPSFFYSVTRDNVRTRD